MATCGCLCWDVHIEKHVNKPEQTSPEKAQNFISTHVNGPSTTGFGGTKIQQRPSNSTSTSVNIVENGPSDTENAQDMTRLDSPAVTETQPDDEVDDIIDENDPAAVAKMKHHERLSAMSKISFEVFNKESQLSFL